MFFILTLIINLGWSQTTFFRKSERLISQLHTKEESAKVKLELYSKLYRKLDEQCHENALSLVNNTGVRVIFGFFESDRLYKTIQEGYYFKTSLTLNGNCKIEYQ